MKNEGSDYGNKDWWEKLEKMLSGEPPKFEPMTKPITPEEFKDLFDKMTQLAQPGPNLWDKFWGMLDDDSMTMDAMISTQEYQEVMKQIQADKSGVLFTKLQAISLFQPGHCYGVVNELGALIFKIPADGFICGRGVKLKADGVVKIRPVPMKEAIEEWLAMMQQLSPPGSETSSGPASTP